MRRLTALLALLLTSTAFAQYFSGLARSYNYVRLEGGAVVDENRVRTARETVGHSITFPEWRNPTGFEHDAFTFARAIFPIDLNREGGNGYAGGRGNPLAWWVDYPDADLNVSYRLNQMTSMRVDPDARVMKLTDPELYRFPFLYFVHIERMALQKPETDALRQYLSNGGFMLVSDFWGTIALNNLKDEMRLAFPGRDWVELTTAHPIFHSVFDINVPMQKLQVPTIQFWNPNYDPSDLNSPTTGRYRGEGSEQMRAWAMFDDHDRMIALALENCDLSDGWEREGEDPDYFKLFSEARSYPLTINILMYVMTH